MRDFPTRDPPGQNDPAKRRLALPFDAQGRSAEEWVPEDWAAVASAIDTRLTELNWRQRELAQRAQVSVAIVRELHRNTTQRRRSTRTLEALSLALGWHPDHLDAVLRSQAPPERGEPESSPVDPVVARLPSSDRRLAAIEKRLDDLTADLATRYDSPDQEPTAGGPRGFSHDTRKRPERGSS